MSIAARDAEAYDLVSRRTFGGAFVASLAFEMQTRRLTLGLYGSLHAGERGTSLATVTFFGASALSLENFEDAFPESVEIASFSLAWHDESDNGRAELRGARGWLLAWSFDGLAYEEHAATIASLVDDDEPAQGAP
jgi:hypothetical protein